MPQKLNSPRRNNFLWSIHCVSTPPGLFKNPPTCLASSESASCGSSPPSSVSTSSSDSQVCYNFVENHSGKFLPDKNLFIYVHLWGYRVFFFIIYTFVLLIGKNVDPMHCEVRVLNENKLTDDKSHSLLTEKNHFTCRTQCMFGRKVKNDI